MANEQRLIDEFMIEIKNEFIELCCGNDFEELTLLEIGETIDRIYEKYIAIPTVDAAPVVHGRWEDVVETEMYVPDMKYTVTHTAETCSACNVRIGFIGSKLYLYDNICPNCGAKMDLEE